MCVCMWGAGGGLQLGLETSRAEPGSARLALARSSSEPSLPRLGNFTSWWKRLGSARYRLASRLEPAREPQLVIASQIKFWRKQQGFNKKHS